MLVESLIREYPFKTELHAHTNPVSKCSDITPEELVRVYRERSVDSVVLTNHFMSGYPDGLSGAEQTEAYLDAYRATRRLGEEQGLGILLGMEIRFPGSTRDYLVYGLEESDIGKAAKFLESDIKSFYRGFKTDKNLIFRAHPFRDDAAQDDPEDLDGVEAYNLHPNHNSRVATAARYAREHGLLVCGGTDFHHYGHEGACLMRTKRKLETSFDVAEALAGKDVIFDVGGSLILPYNFVG